MAAGNMGRRPAWAASVLTTVGVALFVSNPALFQATTTTTTHRPAPAPGMATTEAGTHAVSKAIGDISLEKVRGPGDAQAVTVSSFWKDQTAVVHVLRRFGCRLCRANAAELAKVAPLLEANNVRVVAVGIERLGVEEFVEGGFWPGELYIDNGKKIPGALNIKSVGYLSALAMIFVNKQVKEALAKSKDVPGNLKGDGMQLGATFVVSKTGETLLDFRQKHFADHPTSQSILEACGLDPGLLKSGGGVGGDKEGKDDGGVCDDSCR